MYTKTLRTIYKTRGELHHACLVEGNKGDVVPALTEFFEKELAFRTKGNPDFHLYEYNSFGIDDGRRLQELAVQKPLQKYKIFVTVFNTMTREAQNALLKLFEEPTKGTHFFLITPQTQTLLPTLTSRLFVISREEKNAADTKEAETFLAMPKAERLAALKQLIEEKDKASALQFLYAVESLLYSELQNSSGKKEIADALTEVMRAREYLFDRSSSLKLLLEHVALTVPDVN